MFRFVLIIALLATIITALPAKNSKQDGSQQPDRNQQSNDHQNSKDQQDYAYDDGQFIPLSQLMECGVLRDLFNTNDQQLTNRATENPNNNQNHNNGQMNKSNKN